MVIPLLIFRFYRRIKYSHSNRLNAYFFHVKIVRVRRTLNVDMVVTLNVYESLFYLHISSERITNFLVHFVLTFIIWKSCHGGSWNFEINKNNRPSNFSALYYCLLLSQIFTGNADQDSVVTNMLPCPVLARCIRINPIDWKDHVSLRFDLLGCPAQTGLYHQSLKIIKLSYVSSVICKTFIASRVFSTNRRLGRI